jgi:DNA-binding response OmpR family regulator
VIQPAVQTISDKADLQNGELQSGEKPIILIVEDNVELLSFIALQFHSHYQVLEAPNGKIGWQKALEAIPDIVISDVMMPEMDGIALSRKLKADERTSHIPLILLTAKATEESKLDGLQTGADDYLTKPFSIAELQLRVSNLVEGRRRLRERYSRQIIIQPAQVAVTAADEKFLKRVISIIVEHIDEADFTAEVFEKEVGLSHVQFYRKMKSLTNQAPGEFLRNYRLQQAAMLLKGRHGNVSEIAYTVGFTSLAYFTRCFKALYGQAPSQYLSSQTPSQ